jgi:hypothetical protein
MHAGTFAAQPALSEWRWRRAPWFAIHKTRKNDEKRMLIDN